MFEEVYLINEEAEGYREAIISGRDDD